jgi:hypothetical protein
MKRQLILIIILYSCMCLNAQNIQLHYDLGKDRNYLTSTVEMFKPDKWGSSFFFIDMDYGSADIQGVSRAYWELARGLKFWKSPFEIHVEYNGGFGQFDDSFNNRAYQINDAWLLGSNYTWNNKDLTKIFTLQVMYKNIRARDNMSFQVTGVWTFRFFKNKVTFKGFADFWKDNSNVGDYVFLTEPQLWYNFTSNFSMGSEEELSSNYSGHKGFMVNPTIAAKWTF